MEKRDVWHDCAWPKFGSSISHNPQQARQILEASLEESPDDVHAKRYLVDVTVASGQWHIARRLLEELAAEENPMTQVWALDKLALVAQLGLRDQELRQQCEVEALGVAISLPDVLPQLVSGYRDRNEQQRLIALGTELLSSRSDAEQTYPLRLALARVLLEDLSDPERAMEHLQPALRAHPDDVEPLLLYAQTLEHRHQNDEAAATYRRVLSRSPGSPGAYEGLARLMAILVCPKSAARPRPSSTSCRRPSRGITESNTRRCAHSTGACRSLSTSI